LTDAEDDKFRWTDWGNADFHVQATFHHGVRGVDFPIALDEEGFTDVGTDEGAFTP
jgi:hypothetical protein